MVADVLMFLAAAALGTFSGAMLTEGCVLIPYWRSLGPDAFFAWYRANGKRLVDFFGPLTWITALTSIAAGGASWWTHDPNRWYSLTAAIGMLTTVMMFFVYFEGANARFSAATVPAHQLPAVLARWAAWHWARTTLSLLALATGLLALWN
jgi:hypothetical protein